MSSRPTINPFTPRPLIKLANWCDLYHAIHASIGQQIIPEISKGDWLLVARSRFHQRKIQIMVVDCEQGPLPGPSVQIGLTRLGRRNIIERRYLIKAVRDENQSLKLNGRITVSRNDLREFGTVIGFFHPFSLFPVPKDDSFINLPKRIRDNGRREIGQQLKFLLGKMRRKNQSIPFLQGQCQEQPTNFFECEPPVYFYCVRDRLHNQFFPEIQPRDILIVELDKSKSIPPGRSILIEDIDGRLNGCIHARDFRQSLKSYTVGLFCEETKSGTIEYLVNNGERRRSSKEKTFRGNITCLFRWIG